MQEKLFENKVKNWLESEGIYSLGTAANKMNVPPCGYYEKRWGGGYSKSGLPDMHLVVNSISLDIELKASNGKPSELQEQKIIQINQSGSIAMILYPEGFEQFKNIVKGVIQCNIHIQELNALKTANSNTKCVILIELKQ
jgi:hypothetical protein